MSQLAVNSITDANAGNTATINGMTPTADSLQGFRNRIINGDMRIDQRNAGASVTGNSDVYSLDRWKCVASQSSKFTVQQVTDAPSGFISSLKVTSSSAHSVGSTESFGVRQIIEGYNEADWDWPNVGGKTLTLSFWVKSTLTGTFGGSVFSGADNYIFSYSVSSANTWEYKTLTITAPTAGTWDTTNSAGASIFWSLGCGTDRQQTAGSWYYSNARRSVTGEVQIVANNAATWQITGVQLEVGSVATPFERRPYGTELSLCYRYYYKIFSPNQFRFLAMGQVNSATETDMSVPFPVTMRIRPTALETTGTAADYRVYSNDTNFNATALSYRGEGTDYAARVRVNVASGLTGGYSSSLLTNSGVSTGFLAWSAEL